mgnify:CR=1 FL=1
MPRRTIDYMETNNEVNLAYKDILYTILTMSKLNENKMFDYNMKGQRLITTLSLGARKKLRTVTGNTTTKKMIKEAMESGVELFGSTKNKESQAYQFFADIYNDTLTDYRNRPKQKKAPVVKSINLYTGDWEEVFKNYKIIKAITDTANVIVLKQDGTIYKDFNLVKNKDIWQTFILAVQATSDTTIFEEDPTLSMHMTLAQKAKPSKKKNTII